MTKSVSRYAVTVLITILAATVCVAATTTEKPKAGATCPSCTASKSSAKKSATKQVKTQTKPAAKPAPKALPRLLELGSTTCVPCKMMKPIIDELERDYKGQLKVEFVDVREDKSAAEKYKISSIPVQIFFDANGKEVFRHVGYYSKEDILAKFKELGIKLTPPAKKDT